MDKMHLFLLTMLLIPSPTWARPQPENSPTLEVATTGHANGEVEGKTPDVKDWGSGRKAKGTHGLGGKSGELAKATSGSGNDSATQSAESGSEGSSEESDENNNQQDYAAAANKKGSFDQMLVDGANSQNLGNGATQHVPGNPVGPVSAANMNIGMDLWGTPGQGPVKVRQNPHAAGVMGEQWMDERELKKQKRKQSNRESARRSTLRKQDQIPLQSIPVEIQHAEESKEIKKKIIEDFVIFFAVIIFSSSFWYYCYGRETQIGTPVQPHVGTPVGLDQKVIESFVVRSLSEDEELPYETTGCDICLSDFTLGDQLMVLPDCSHVFHVSCVQTWLLLRPTCPNCRHDFS